MQIIDHSKCDLIIEKEKPGLICQGKEIEDVDGIIPRTGASITFYGTAVIRQFEMMKVLLQQNLKPW
jgi:ribosomal protein S6--L-glutamate ligase